MVRTENLRKVPLCLLVAVALKELAKNSVEAAVLPRNTPLNVIPMNSDLLSAPTPLSVVSTYTLYFGHNGATVSAPVVSQTAATASSGTTSTTSTPVRSTSKVGRCPPRHTSSVPSAATTSTSVNGTISSTVSSASVQNVVFPTAASTIPTESATSQRVSPNFHEVLPHKFINKVDSLVETYHGITGRKARQVALILSNQTTVIANTSRTDTILANLAQAYPANNGTAVGGATNHTSLLNVTTVANQTATASTPEIGNSTQLAHLYMIQAGRSNMTLLSNVPGYGPDQVRHDLHVIRKWAGDLDQLSTPALLDETVAAIMSASARYFPELSTQDAARVIMADMKAESDFDTDNISGGRLDSGSSWGLLQVSPFGSGELQLFQQHATVTKNTFSWDEQYNISTQPASFGAGPLLDWETGKILDVKQLNNEDLFRPWVNVHVATWIQSNLARTSSQDPSTWPNVYEKSNTARRLDNDKQGRVALNQALVGAGLPRSCLTALGSWVAGPAVDGYGSYDQQGDDVSTPYFRNIAQGLSVLYGKTIKPSWLNTLTLHAGLVDYH